MAFIRLLSTLSLLLLALPSVFANGAPERPLEHNTGPTSPVEELREIGTTKITEDGAVLENFRSSGTIQIAADNVTVRNFYIDSNGWYGIQVMPGAKNAVIEDGEITGTKSAAVNGGNYAARRLHVHHVGKDALKISSNVIIESCYIHHVGDAEKFPKVHADGIQSVGGDNVLIRWNNIDMPLGKDGALNHHCIIIQAQRSTLDNIRIEENWLNGGGFSVQLRSKNKKKGGYPTNSAILNNYFGDDCKHGNWYKEGDVQVSGNRRQADQKLLRGQ